jgi:hypothetical protein
MSSSTSAKDRCSKRRRFRFLCRLSLPGRTRSDVELVERVAVDRSASGRSRPLKSHPGFQTECLKRALERSQTACANLHFLPGPISTKGYAIRRLAPASVAGTIELWSRYARGDNVSMILHSATVPRQH